MKRSTRKRGAPVLCALALLLAWRSPLNAAQVTDGQAADSIVSVRLDPRLAAGEIGPSLMSHLRAELSASNLRVETQSAMNGSAAIPDPLEVHRTGLPRTVPRARLSVIPSDDDRVITLELLYPASGVSVRRAVNLAQLPSDGVPLAIAVAADELVRATWPLGTAPSPPVPAAPAPVVRPSTHLRLLWSGERQSDGVFSMGPTVQITRSVSRWIVPALHAGWRRAESRAAPNGRIDTSAALAGLAALFPVTGPLEARAGLAVHTGIDVAWVKVTGRPAPGASAHDSRTIGSAMTVGLSGWGQVAAPVGLVGFVGWQRPLRSVTATDGGQPAGAAFHPGFSAAAGVGARFP